MPSYSYTCSTCDVTSLVFRNLYDPEKIPTCIKCDKPMARQYGSPTITFKGTGFYSTDK